MENFYLKKYGFCEPALAHRVNPDVGIIVVIPCFNESNLIDSLQSLSRCDTPKSKVEVIVVINAAENANAEAIETNLCCYNEAKDWISNHNNDWITFQVMLKHNLPQKHAGVGLARKIGMDEAVARFHEIGKDGVIVMFDADSLCLPNYLSEIEKHFSDHPKTPGCSIHYEHPIDGEEYSKQIYNGIINYELFLRYYNQGLRRANLPYAYHTVGSSMAVRSSAYQKQGGMNKRKAGEDFYFIQKIIELGNYTELTTTMVIPSPRISDRVPFGTGKAIGEWVTNSPDYYATYNPQSFEELKRFNSILNEGYENPNLKLPGTFPKALKTYLENEDFNAAFNNAKNNSKDITIFKKRVYQWFNAFKVLKFVHFARDNFYNDIPIVEAVLEQLSVDVVETSPKELLKQYRLMESKKPN